MRELRIVPLDLVNIQDAPQSAARQLSLLGHGQVDVIRLCPTDTGRYDIIDGRRRVQDLVVNGATEVEAIVEEVDEATAHLHSLILNTGTPNKMDEALHIRELQVKFGWTLEELSEATGMSTGTLSNRTKLLELVPSLQRRVATGDIIYSAAYELSKLPRKVQTKMARRKGTITCAHAQEARRAWEAETMQTGAISIPEWTDVEETGPGLFLTYTQMIELLDGSGELFMEWNGRKFTLNHDCL